jgi:ABC-type transport system involved in multi-copper enzyme maturation permease subunit
MAMVSQWLLSNRQVYFGNATATRDFRVQLRGNRSALLFGIYLVLLIGVAMLNYGEAIGDQRMSVIVAQQHLKEFYTVVMYCLAIAISLVAPALSATTVVMERQRRSMDLVFSAPVSPKYYLVGKMLSSYRYIWMLLALSLPVTASCVVLGGASWGDVIGAYFLLSVQALAFTSIALLMSTVAQKPVSAVLWSYAACVPYAFLTFALSESLSMRSMFSHSFSSEVAFPVALSPFNVMSAVGTFTRVGEVQVPNWLFALAFSLLVSKIALLCAGALLSPYGGKEARSLRIHGLIYLLLIFGFGGYEIGGVMSISSSEAFEHAKTLGYTYFSVLLPLAIFVPFITCYGFDGERRLRPNGIFSMRKMFDPTPASGLPYLATLVLGSGIAGAIGDSFGRMNSVSGISMASMAAGGPGAILGSPSFSLPGATFLCFLAYAAGFWALMWSIGRYTSSLLLGIRQARTLHLAAIIAICLLPLPILITMFPIEDGNPLPPWRLWLLSPLVDYQHEGGAGVLTYGILSLGIAALITYASEAKLKAKLAAPVIVRSAVTPPPVA